MTTVRAAILNTARSPLVIETLTLDEPGPREVRVRYGASGVCHSDLHVIDGDWTVLLPLVLGHEGAGVIDAVGAGVDHVHVGDTVVVTWHYPCGSCRQCANGRDWLCSRSRSDQNLLDDGTHRLHRADGEAVFQYLSVGTFAEQAVIPASAAVPIPAGVPFDVACLIGCCVTTGVGAVVNTADVEPGASVCVIGCGGVGLSCVMGAALAGAAPIIAVDLEPAKLDQAGVLGATHLVRGGDDLARRVRAIVPGGVDYAFEAIGIPAVGETLPRLVTAGGTAVLVGMSAEHETLAVNAYVFPARGLALLGSAYGSARVGRDFPRFASLYLAGRLPIDQLVTRRIALDEVNDAFAAMRRREGGRSVIVYDPPT
jgi:Zn-dependent alcohol dehydrogenase